MQKALILPFLGMALCAIALSQTQRLLLGVLEDTPGHYTGEPHFRSVRALFYRAGEEWKPFPGDCRNPDCLTSVASQYPLKVIWTIGFDGRILGQLAAQTPSAFQFYADVGQQQILSTSAIPTIGKRSAAFAGWLGEPVYRPLVANSHPYFSDPEGWKPSQAPDVVVNRTRHEFRKKHPKLGGCEAPGEVTRYADADIRQVKSYVSSSGWRLVQMAINGCLPGDERGDSLASEWFAADPTGHVSYLDRHIWLLDAGDYDNDGRSEVMFLIDDYNRGGYKLFYENFKKTVVFKFSYH